MNALHAFYAYIERRRRRLREENAATRRVAFCTIATQSFVPWALVLFDSLRKHHPQAELVLLYVREAGEERREPAMQGVHVIGIDKLLGDEAEAGLRARYGLAELCFALKPRLLRHCLDRFGERAIYLDSDIDVVAPLAEALVALELASVALTPHLDAPLPLDGKVPSEMTVLRAGSCNAGFVGVGESGAARRMLDWWDERVARWGFLTPEVGYQGDQKWLDLARSMFDGVRLLRDPGSNVGACNLHSRRLARDAQGVLRANDARLAFVHFSGFDPERPEVLSKYQNRHDPKDHPVFMALARDFAARVVAARERAKALHWNVVEMPASPEPAATVRPDMLPEGGYRARLEARRGYEGILAAGEELPLHVKVTNDSPHRWNVGRNEKGEGGIALTWHLRSTTGAMLVENHPRVWLPRDMDPGETVEVRLGARMPPTPGTYRVELDLVHEGFAWFAGQGSPTLTLQVDVDAIPVVEPPPSLGGAGGKGQALP